MDKNVTSAEIKQLWTSLLGVWTLLPKSSPHNSDVSGHCLSFAMKFKGLNKSIKSATI